MPPVMNRKDSQERCRKGWELRRRGRTWQEIADELGWRSKGSACGAINTWLEKNPPDDLVTMRRATGDTLVETSMKMLEYADEAKTAGKYRDAAELAKVGIDGLDKHAKLTGQHIAVASKQEVSVKVQTMTEIVNDTRARLMNVIDAEVIDLSEPVAVEAPK